MEVAEESPVASAISGSDGNLRLRIKTTRGDTPSPEKSGLAVPHGISSYLEETWADEPMTPAGRVFTELNLKFVCVCILAFKYPIDKQKFKDNLELTLMKHKRFASRVETRKNIPWWTRVKTNVDDHVFVADLTPEQKEDSDCVANYTTDVVLRRPFDQSKPLWDMHLLDAKLGEADGCCIARIHHSLGDGTSLISLLMACTRSVEKPDSLPSERKNERKQSRHTSFLSSLFLTIWKYMLVLWYSFTEIGRAAATLIWMKDSDTAVKGFAGVEYSPVKYRFTIFSVDDIKYVSRVMGVTVNDVFMAMAAHGLRRYLEHPAYRNISEGSDPASEKLVAGDKIGQLINPGPRKNGVAKTPETCELDKLRIRAVALINMRPIPGLRELSDMMNGSASQSRWGNHMGYLLVPLPMKLYSDPLELLRETKAIGNRKKSSLEGPFSYAFGDMLMRLCGQKAAAAIVYRTTLQTSISLSNIKGPSEQVMFADNPITHIIPSVTGHPHALTIHLQSYNGKVSLVAMAAKQLIPDPEYLLQLCMDGLQKMKQAAGAVSRR